MIYKILPVLFFIAVTSTQNTDQRNVTDEIQHPQLGSVQRILNLGKPNEILPGMSPEKFIQDYKSKPKTKVFKSDNYPNPYPVKETSKWRFSVESGTGIDVVIYVLDLDPEMDHLKISPVVNNKAENGKIFTGVLKEPLKLRFLETRQFEIEFGAGGESSHSHKGFFMTYGPYGTPPDPTTPPPQPIIPFEEVDVFDVLLQVPQAQQKIETWNIFRNILCNATNDFILSMNLKLQGCQPQKVTIKSINKCPEQWPNSEKCIDFLFGITLIPLMDENTANDPILRDAVEPVGLRRTQLKKLWVRFGRSAFIEAGYLEYNMPNFKANVLVWIGIGLGVVFVSFIILTTMCRINAIRDYWPSPTDDKHQILQNSPEMDISMFPSPDQVVPPLFPATGNRYEPTRDASFNDNSETKPTEREALRRNSKFGVSGGVFNRGFVDDNIVIKREPEAESAA